MLLAKGEEIVGPGLGGLTVFLSEIVGKFETSLSVSLGLGGDSADDGDDHEEDVFHSMVLFINYNSHTDLSLINQNVLDHYNYSFVFNNIFLHI